MVLTNKSPKTAVSSPDQSDVSPKARVASGTLPPEAAQAPEFVPGRLSYPAVPYRHPNSGKGEQRTPEPSSDKERTPPKKPKKRNKAEAEAKARKEQAMEEEWWSGDEDFVPKGQPEDDIRDDVQN